MALVIRLSRYGSKSNPFYRIVATEKASKRDGKYIEIVGTYSTLVKGGSHTLKEDRIKHWVQNGAKPSQVVGNLIKKTIPGFLEEREKHQRDKIIQARKKRKARLSKKKKAA